MNLSKRFIIILFKRPSLAQNIISNVLHIDNISVVRILELQKKFCHLPEPNDILISEHLKVFSDRKVFMA